MENIWNNILGIVVSFIYVFGVIFLAKFLETRDLAFALSHTISAIFAIFEKTWRAGTRELQLIAAQDEIVAPSQRFSAVKVR